MQLASALSLLLLTVFFCGFSAAECIPISEARQHLGEDRCVVGRVVRIRHGSGGVTSLEFCQEALVCPFTVVAFPHELRNVGDVSELQGRVIQIHGLLKEYDGRAEIVLQRVGQLTGEAARIPPLPRNFDVEYKGHFSPGKFSLPRPKHPSHKKRYKAKLPFDIPEDTSTEEEAGAPP